VRRILHLPPPVEPHAAIEINGVKYAEVDAVVTDMERSVATYLRRTVDKFDLTKCVEVSAHPYGRLIILAL